MIVAKAVKTLGLPVGNLWDIYHDNDWLARVAYKGNALDVIKGSLKPRCTVAEAEYAIEHMEWEGYNP